MRKQAPSTTPSLSTPPATNNLPDARGILPTVTSSSGSTYVAPHSLPSHVTQAAALLLQPQAERKRETTPPHQSTHPTIPLCIPLTHSFLYLSPRNRAYSLTPPFNRCPATAPSNAAPNAAPSTAWNTSDRPMTRTRITATAKSTMVMRNPRRLPTT